MINDQMMSDFAPVPGGWFDMGSREGRDNERPVRHVWVSAFEMARCPVTRRDYATFLDDAHHDRPRDWTNPALAQDDQPVVGVSWHDAAAYCAWRTSRGDPVRLPTEAEWERAARGVRAGARFPWGDEVPGWIPRQGRGPLDGPWRAAAGEPNDFGLHGIAANIHEWCADWYGPYDAASTHDPVGPPGGRWRASRGGSWRHAITISRCAARSRLDPSFRYTDYGFRLARTTHVI